VLIVEDIHYVAWSYVGTCVQFIKKRPQFRSQHNNHIGYFIWCKQSHHKYNNENCA